MIAVSTRRRCRHERDLDAQEARGRVESVPRRDECPHRDQCRGQRRAEVSVVPRSVPTSVPCRDQCRADRDVELAVPHGGDPPPRLHRGLHRSGALAEERSCGVDVRGDIGDAPERRRPVTGSSWCAHDLDDHLTEPEKDLPDRLSAEFSAAFPARVFAESLHGRHGAIGSGDSSTTWSIAVTPLECSAGAARGASVGALAGAAGLTSVGVLAVAAPQSSERAVAMPSSSPEKPAGSPPKDQPTIPLPWCDPTSRIRTPPTRQHGAASPAESTVKPARAQASGASATWISSTVRLMVCGPLYAGEVLRCSSTDTVSTIRPAMASTAPAAAGAVYPSPAAITRPPTQAPVALPMLRAKWFNAAARV